VILRRVLAGAAAAVVAVPVAMAAVWGSGYEDTRVSLSSGTAWLASPGQSLVTLVDGPSELVLGSVRTGGRVDRVVPVGSSALLLDDATGTVTRVDGGTYDLAGPFEFGAGPGTVVAGQDAAYVIDARGSAAVVDPRSMVVQRTVELGVVPGEGQAVVDGSGRLWVVDAGSGGLVGLTGASGEPARSADAGASARLTVVQGRPVVVEPAQQRAGWVGDDAGVDTWACFPQAPAGQVQLLGSAGSARVYAGVPGTGTLVVSDLESGECGQPVRVGNPGEPLGQLVEAGGFVLVPNEATGRAAVVDVAAAEVTEELVVLPEPGGRLQLVARDGLVFYNDLAGERAGVLGFDGTQWTVGSASQKFLPGATGLAEPVRPLASGSGVIPPDRPPVGLPPPRGQQTRPVDPGEVVVPANPGGPATVPTAPTSPTTPTTPTTATTVVTPDVSFARLKTFPSALPSIQAAVQTACGDQSLCLVIGTAINPNPLITTVALAPCTITGVPAAGATVPRRSAFTLLINEPCGGTGGEPPVIPIDPGTGGGEPPVVVPIDPGTGGGEPPDSGGTPPDTGGTPPDTGIPDTGAETGDPQTTDPAVVPEPPGAPTP
jgi:hypothetical protein